MATSLAKYADTKRWPRIKMSIPGSKDVYLYLAHEQYLWLGDIKQGPCLAASANKTSVRRFAKACLAALKK